MLALVYLTIVIVLGACICQRFYCFVSFAHYMAASFLVGAMLSTWATYLFALLFARSNQPLLGANILFFALAGLAICKLLPRSVFQLRLGNSRPPGSARWDAVFLCAFLLIACYLMFGTLSLGKGNVRLASVVWNDFGPNLSLMQSFAMGHNFPTEYPHFIGEPIRYHFLFWFQAGNLEFLGLNTAWALNLLSVLSLLAMVTLIMVLGEILFKSRTVGRIAACLFFLPSTLSYFPFLHSQKSLGQALGAIVRLDHWLASGYHYKGEDWGTWSLSIFYVQRHFLAGIGILLLVLIFLVEFFQRNVRVRHQLRADKSGEVGEASEISNLSTHTQNSNPEIPALSGDTRTLSGNEPQRHFRSFAFSGFLLGLLPLWNSPAFVAALVLLAGVFLLFPHRAYVLSLVIIAAIVGVPQVWFLFSRGSSFMRHSPLIHWGLVVENPTLSNVLGYFFFTFGPKFLLGLVALWLLWSVPRRMFGAALVLPILAFTTQLSTDIINNHKFLYIWLIIINLFVAFILWRIGKAGIFGKAVAIVLAVVVTLGGTIEWFRIHNDNLVDVPFNQDPLSKWLQTNTKPTDIFLTDKYVIHPILLNGRRIFYGWPYFSWSMGYPTHDRDVLYEKMFTEKNPVELVRLLRENGIRYVAIDNGVRSGFPRARLNEPVYKSYFERVFDDKGNQFGSLVIYRVPDRIRKDAS